MEHLPDLAFLRRLQPLRRLYARYFHADLTGWERIPPGPALLVGNHSGGLVSPETVLFVLSYYARPGAGADPLLLLAHDALFVVPGVGWIARRVGAVPASPDVAAARLRAGGKVLVFPGGDHEALRPSRDRDRVDLAGRTGFVTLALRCGVPIVPFVTAGAHDVYRILWRGERLSRALGLDRLLRLKAFPVALGLPWGLILGPVPPLLPRRATVRTEVLPPLRLEGDPDDPAAVWACYARVEATMQAALTRLAADLPGR